MKFIPLSKYKYNNSMLKIQAIYSILLCGLFYLGYGIQLSDATQIRIIKSASQQGEVFAEFLIEKQKEAIQEAADNLSFSKQEDVFEETSKRSNSFLERTAHPQLLVFVSFSMPFKALVTVAKEAKKAGGILVLRGLKAHSFKATTYAVMPFIEKTGQGILIDPLLFRQFDIHKVPSFVLTKHQKCLPHQSCVTQKFDKLTGHVSVPYALEEISKNGDLKEEAKAFLKKVREQT